MGCRLVAANLPPVRNHLVSYTWELEWIEWLSFEPIVFIEELLWNRNGFFLHCFRVLIWKCCRMLVFFFHPDFTSHRLWCTFRCRQAHWSNLILYAGRGIWLSTFVPTVLAKLGHFIWSHRINIYWLWSFGSADGYPGNCKPAPDSDSSFSWVVAIIFLP